MHFWALKNNEIVLLDALQREYLNMNIEMKIPVCVTICRETMLPLFFIEIWSGQPTFVVKWQTAMLWIKQLSKEITAVQRDAVTSYFYVLNINETSFGRGKFPIYDL